MLRSCELNPVQPRRTSPRSLRAVSPIGAHATALAMATLVGACSKLTVENYDRLQAGMTLSEVRQLLGDPASCDEVVGLRKCIWGDERRQITVSFAADRLLLRSASGIK